MELFTPQGSGVGIIISEIAYPHIYRKKRNLIVF